MELYEIVDGPDQSGIARALFEGTKTVFTLEGYGDVELYINALETPKGGLRTTWTFRGWSATHTTFFRGWEATYYTDTRSGRITVAEKPPVQF